MTRFNELARVIMASAAISSCACMGPSAPVGPTVIAAIPGEDPGWHTVEAMMVLRQAGVDFATGKQEAKDDVRVEDFYVARSKLNAALARSTNAEERAVITACLTAGETCAGYRWVGKVGGRVLSVSEAGLRQMVAGSADDAIV